MKKYIFPSQEHLIRRLSALLCTISLVSASHFPLIAQSRAIGVPGTYEVSGFGFDSKGGTEGKIIIVNNLNASGPGSFVEALNTPGPRIIVFEVGGVIDLLGKAIRISAPFVTIAGQTAPDPGITLIKGGIEIITHDVILQHIRIRSGEAGYAKESGWEMDGLTTGTGAYNVIVDHCSFSWATDENLSATGPRFAGETPEEWRSKTSHKILFRYNLIAEGLSYSTHSKGEHSNGSLIHDNATEIAIVRNLYANNVNRNPLFKGGTQGVVINNFIYNPQQNGIQYKLSTQEWAGRNWIDGKLTIIGNVIEFGYNTRSNFALTSFVGPCEVFWARNRAINKKREPFIKIAGVPDLVKQPPVWPRGLQILSTKKIKDHLLKEAGARPWDRDLTDQRIIEEIRKGQGRIINSEQEVGGYPRILPTYRKFNPDDWVFLQGPQTK